MKIKVITLSLCMLAGLNLVNGQEKGKKLEPEKKKHEFRLSASDGLTQSNVNVLGMGLSDALTGTKRSGEKSSLVYGLGYRYSLNKFRLGADLGFCKTDSKLAFNGNQKPDIKERELNFMVLPTAEFVYFKRGLFELYGGASAGLSLKRNTETGLTKMGKQQARKAELNTSFAYQINPIAVRVGNDRIGGFVELGLGHKGFLTAGISLRF